jgi:hypothetical protein
VGASMPEISGNDACKSCSLYIIFIVYACMRYRLEVEPLFQKAKTHGDSDIILSLSGNPS